MELVRKATGKMRIFKFAFPRASIVACASIFLVFLAGFLWRSGSLGVPVVLRFNEVQGVLRLGDQSEIFGLWLAFVAIFLLNIFLSEYFFLRERFFSYALLAVNILLTVIFSVVGILIFLIN